MLSTPYQTPAENDDDDDDDDDDERPCSCSRCCSCCCYYWGNVRPMMYAEWSCCSCSCCCCWYYLWVGWCMYDSDVDIVCTMTYLYLNNNNNMIFLISNITCWRGRVRTVVVRVYSLYQNESSYQCYLVVVVVERQWRCVQYNASTVPFYSFLDFHLLVLLFATVMDQTEIWFDSSVDGYYCGSPLFAKQSPSFSHPLLLLLFLFSLCPYRIIWQNVYVVRIVCCFSLTAAVPLWLSFLRLSFRYFLLLSLQYYSN